jgi:hypothetical protein
MAGEDGRPQDLLVEVLSSGEVGHGGGQARSHARGQCARRRAGGPLARVRGRLGHDVCHAWFEAMRPTCIPVDDARPPARGQAGTTAMAEAKQDPVAAGWRRAIGLRSPGAGL